MTDKTYHRQYSPGEELAHVISHGIGLGLVIAGLVMLLVATGSYGHGWHVVSAAISGSSLILLYLASTLCHFCSAPGVKRIFPQLDHSMIRVLIAGTYTPLTLVTLRASWSWTLFGLVWAMALIGLVLELALGPRLPWLFLPFYLTMGWLLVLAAKPLVRSLTHRGPGASAAGRAPLHRRGNFPPQEKSPLPPHIWHLFWLAGSGAHFLAIWRYVRLPAA